MEKKSATGLKVLVIIIGILAVVLLALNVTVMLKANHYTELDPVSYEEPEDMADDMGQDIEEVMSEFSNNEPLVAVNEPAVEEEEEGAETEDAKEKKKKYICSYSDSRLITEDDMEKILSKDLGEMPDGRSVPQMMINEMYARYGYSFKNEYIQAYFDEKEWYQNIEERNTDMDDIYSRMTDIEKENVNFLSAY